jgi:hypothetical protein
VRANNEIALLPLSAIYGFAPVQRYDQAAIKARSDFWSIATDI